VLEDIPARLGVPRGRSVTLAGRGRTWVLDLGGEGAETEGGRTGGRPPLVLLHGLGATAALNWAMSLQALGREFRVVALDQRGHGRGVRTRLWPFRLEDAADDAVALADALSVERFVAVGYSMGGPVAQLAWRRHPDRVAGLVLCATAARFSPGPHRPDLGELAVRQLVRTGLLTTSTALRMVPPRLRRGLLAIGVNRRVSYDHLGEFVRSELLHSDPAAVLEALQALQRFNSESWLAEVDVPTAVVVTAFDQLVPPGRQTRMAAAIPGALVVEVAGDHSICVSDPARFVPALVRACRHVSAMAGART